MKTRYPFLLKCAEYDDLKKTFLPQKERFDNFSMWGIGGYAFGYFEGESQDKDRMSAILEELPKSVMCLCRPGQMDLMYENLGCVRSNKDGLSHRVFSARLKPGCADEYKRRHTTIQQLPTDRQTFESNWGVWLGDGHVFGYCERDFALRKEPSEELRKMIVQWETAQLEIMDWLTDDVDWLTGQKHPAVQQIL